LRHRKSLSAFRQKRTFGTASGNDTLALAIMKRLQDNGVHIPDDLAITGWDDALAARYISPGLTTVRQPMQDLGRLAAERLHARIVNEQPVIGSEVLPTRVIVRSSCGCPALSAPARA